MPVLPPVKWVLLMPDGSVHMSASADGPRDNVTQLLREAVGAMFCFPNLPNLFIAGPVATVVGTVFTPGIGSHSRVWKFAGLDPELWQLFVWQNGGALGLGPSEEAVQATVQAIQCACRSLNDAGDLQR